MLTKYKWLLQIGAALALIAALVGGGFAAGWQWQAANGAAALAEAESLHAATLGEISRAAAGQLQRQQQRANELQQQLGELDNKHYAEMTDVQQDNAQLAADLATAEQRLSVRLASPAAGTGRVPTGNAATGLDDGAGARADIHPATAAGLVRVTARADECRARLTGLQGWADAVSASQWPR
ncbi:MAG: lysis system i-spanin subunit Rz [Halopseudomonas sp.]|uniref:lysis system i-spanin subunit Rz n=1 Tax=Halopseudomonas sp. TaxID=2901191 RepID=UPI0030015ED4